VTLALSYTVFKIHPETSLICGSRQWIFRDPS